MSAHCQARRHTQGILPISQNLRGGAAVTSLPSLPAIRFQESRAHRGNPALPGNLSAKSGHCASHRLGDNSWIKERSVTTWPV